MSFKEVSLSNMTPRSTMNEGDFLASSVSFEKIPPEIMVKIFEQLGNLSDCTSLALVNRSTAEVSQLDTVWSELIKRHFPDQNRLPWKSPLEQFKDLHYRIDSNLACGKFTETVFNTNSRAESMNFQGSRSEKSFSFSKNNNILFFHGVTSGSGTITVLERNNKNGKYENIQTILIHDAYPFIEGDRIFLKKTENNEFSLTIMGLNLKSGQFEQIQTIKITQISKETGVCAKDDFLFLGSPNKIAIFQFDRQTNKFIEVNSLANERFNHYLYVRGNFLCVSDNGTWQCDETWFKEGEVFNKFLDLRAKGIISGTVCASDDLICINDSIKSKVHIWQGRTPVQTLTKHYLDVVKDDFLITNSSFTNRTPLVIWKRNRPGKFVEFKSMPAINKQWYDTGLTGDYFFAVQRENFSPETDSFKIWKKNGLSNSTAIFSRLNQNIDYPDEIDFREGNLFTVHTTSVGPSIINICDFTHNLAENDLPCSEISTDI